MSTQAQLPRVRVAAVLVEEDTILLVRHVKDGSNYWLLPGGGVDFGETLHEALVREVHEETGLEVVPERLVLASDSIAPDGSRHMVQLVFAVRCTSGRLGPSSDPRVAEAQYVALEALPTLDLRPPMAEQILEGVHRAWASSPAYLGQLWRR